MRGGYSWILGRDRAKQNMATISTLAGLVKSRNFVKHNQLKIFGDGSLATGLLTIVAFAGMVDGQFHMTGIVQTPQPGEQVIDNGGGGGDVGGGDLGGDGEIYLAAVSLTKLPLQCIKSLRSSEPKVLTYLQTGGLLDV